MLDENRPWGDVSIVLLEDDHMRRLNREHFGRDTTTDVISFAYPPAPGETSHAGDVMINVEQAVREGPRQAGSQNELALYIAHGCHHLAGASDDTPARKRRMLDLEQDWLRQAAPHGLPGRLIQEKP